MVELLAQRVNPWATEHYFQALQLEFSQLKFEIAWDLGLLFAFQLLPF